jgi:hypothetical protein
VASIPSQSITNLSTNPSVETDTTGFTGGTRGTSVRTTAAAKEGSYGMQFTVNQVGYFPRIYLPVLLVSPSTVYTISVWVKSDAQVRIAYAVNSGTIISGNLTDSNSQWVRLSITTSSTPTNATNIATSVGFADNSPLNSTFDVDGIMITQGSTNFKYSDGSTTGWTWSGTVNKSSSSGMSL